MRMSRKRGRKIKKRMNLVELNFDNYREIVSNVELLWNIHVNQ